MCADLSKFQKYKYGRMRKSKKLIKDIEKMFANPLKFQNYMCMNKTQNKGIETGLQI